MADWAEHRLEALPWAVVGYMELTVPGSPVVQADMSRRRVPDKARYTPDESRSVVSDYMAGCSFSSPVDTRLPRV